MTYELDPADGSRDYISTHIPYFIMRNTTTKELTTVRREKKWDWCIKSVWWTVTN